MLLRDSSLRRIASRRFASMRSFCSMVRGMSTVLGFGRNPVNLRPLAGKLSKSRGRDQLQDFQTQNVFFFNIGPLKTLLKSESCSSPTTRKSVFPRLLVSECTTCCGLEPCARRKPSSSVTGLGNTESFTSTSNFGSTSSTVEMRAQETRGTSNSGWVFGMVVLRNSVEAEISQLDY